MWDPGLDPGMERGRDGESGEVQARLWCRPWHHIGANSQRHQWFKETLTQAKPGGRNPRPSSQLFGTFKIISNRELTNENPRTVRFSRLMASFGIRDEVRRRDLAG